MTTQTPQDLQAKVEAFAAVLLEARKAALRSQYPDSDLSERETVNVKPRRLYTLVDVGPAHNMSGRYMVDNATGIIYGIKAYGKVHKGHSYGTIDTIDEWDWNELYCAPRRKTDERILAEYAADVATADAARMTDAQLAANIATFATATDPSNKRRVAACRAEQDRRAGG